MKKLLFIAVAFALYNHWGAVAGWLRGEPNVADMRGSFSVTEDGVVLYATSWCGYCQKTRELLVEQNVPYIEYDIERSPEGRRQYDALRGRGVPILTVGDTVVRGYNRREILALLD